MPSGFLGHGSDGNLRVAMATGRPHRLSLCDVSLGFILRCGVVASSSSSTNTDAMTTVPVHFDVVAESLEPSFQKDFPNYRRGLARGTPGGFVLTPDFAKMADDVYNIPLRSDDTWIVTFPKCGALAEAAIEGVETVDRCRSVGSNILSSSF